MSSVRRTVVAFGFVLAGTGTYVCLSSASVAATDLEQCPSTGACSKPLWVEHPTVPAGGVLRYSGDMFASNGTVRLSFDDPAYVTTVIATNARGRAEGETEVPAQAAVGAHQVVMAGVDGYGRSLVEPALVTVRPGSARSTNTVAEAVLTLAGPALTLGLAAGAILTAVWRRPKGPAPQAPA